MSTNKKKKNTKGGKSTTASSIEPPARIEHIEDAIRQLKELLNTAALINSTDDEDEKKYYRSIEASLEKHLRAEFNKGTYHNVFDSVKKLISDSGVGIYVMLRSIGVSPKIGMSLVNKFRRVNQQDHVDAGDLASVDDVNRMLPDECEVVQDIKNAMPPSLNYYFEKEEDRVLHIKLQIVEIMIAACHVTSTGVAGERLMMLPSKYIQELTTLLSPEEFSAEDIAFIVGDGKEVDIEKLFTFFLSWSTYRYDLHKRREEGDEVLKWLLPEQPEDKFVKLHMLRRVFGGKERVSTFVDAKEDSVRLEQMAGIIQELKKKLAKAKEEELIGEMTDETREALCGIIKRINKDSDDYKHYKEPERQVIAEAAALQLRDLIKNNTGQIIIWERHMFNAVKQYQPVAYAEFFPPSSSEFVEVLEDSDHLLRITATLPGGKVVKHLIIRSFFRIFAEDTSLVIVLSEIEAYVGTLSYLCAAGIISQEYAQREALVMQTYLMEYEGLGGDIENGITEGSFRYARQHAVGKGLCLGGSIENVRSVATVLKIGYLETLDICSQLGDEKFGLLLNAHGIKDGANNPMNESFACQGVMAAGSLKARPCPYQGCDKEDMPCVFVAGINLEDWVLPFKFGCTHCATLIYPREVKVIEQRIDAEESGNENVFVTEAQRKRVEKREQSNAKSNAKRNAKSREVTALKKRAEAGDEKLTSSEKKRVEKRKQKLAKRNAKSREVTALKKRAEAGDEKLTSSEKKRVEKREQKLAKSKETTKLLKQDISSLSTDEKVRVEKRKQDNANLMKWRDNKRQKSGKTKQNASVPWTVEEDETILQSVPTGAKWANIAAQLVGRTGKQVRDRWTDVLNPKLDKGSWKDADDLRLWNAYNEMGPGKWVDISKEKFEERRSGNHVKNRFNGAAFKGFVSKKYGCDAYKNAKNAWN